MASLPVKGAATWELTPSSFSMLRVHSAAAAAPWRHSGAGAHAAAIVALRVWLCTGCGANVRASAPPQPATLIRRTRAAFWWKGWAENACYKGLYQHATHKGSLLLPSLPDGCPSVCRRTLWARRRRTHQLPLRVQSGCAPRTYLVPCWRRQWQWHIAPLASEAQLQGEMGVTANTRIVLLLLGFTSAGIQASRRRRRRCGQAVSTFSHTRSDGSGAATTLMACSPWKRSGLAWQNMREMLHTDT